MWRAAQLVAHLIMRALAIPPASLQLEDLRRIWPGRVVRMHTAHRDKVDGVGKHTASGRLMGHCGA